MPEKIICAVTNDLVYDQRMQRICTSLQNNKFKVQLVGRTLKNSVDLQQMAYQQYRFKCIFNKGFLFYAEYNIRLFIYLLFQSFDIVCGCDLDTLPATFLAAKIKRKKITYDAHEFFTESPELIGRPFIQSIWLFVEKLLVPKVDAVYTVTKSIAKLYNEKYPVSCSVILNMPLKNKIKNTTQHTNQQTPILLYQGAVNIGRGLNEMLLAMLKIEGAEFHIVGGGDEFENIKQHISELHLENKVKLLGKKTPAELRQLTQQAYIGINLLENRGLSYYYSLGNKTFDYIHAAVPQVMIGFPEYIALNKQYNIGVLVHELNMENVYAAITQLLIDKKLYKQLQINCEKTRNSLCWEKEEPKLIAIYNALKVKNNG